MCACKTVFHYSILAPSDQEMNSMICLLGSNVIHLEDIKHCSEVVNMQSQSGVKNVIKTTKLFKTNQLNINISENKKHSSPIHIEKTCAASSNQLKKHSNVLRWCICNSLLQTILQLDLLIQTHAGRELHIIVIRNDPWPSCLICTCFHAIILQGAWRPGLPNVAAAILKTITCSPLSF